MTNEPEIAINLGNPAAAADAAVPILNEAAPPMDLPERATLNDDGTVTLTFEFPCKIEYRMLGGGVARTEDFDHLVLHRMRGLDMRKVLAAKNTDTAALAISAGLTVSKLELLMKVMDAADANAAERVVQELLGGMANGLPAHAEETADGVTLPLLYPATDGDGASQSELTFKRMTAADTKAIGQAKDPLDWAVHRTTGLSPKAVKGLIDDMDAADVVAAQRVINFLSGNGRRTGR
jgi:hypothetical protein